MTVRQERKDAAEHRRKILQTAEKLFDEHGVNAVSMHQIAKTAGVGQGTLYRRYAHKGDLCLDLIQDFSREFMEQIERYLKKNENLSPQERLGAILDLWIDMIEKKAELIMTVQAHQMMEAEESRAATFFQSPLYSYVRQRMSELLAEIAASESGAQADPTLTAHALICALAPHGYFHMKQEKNYSTDQMKQNFRRLCRIPPQL
ncbi:TetR/AcrR family transcriptional regulator [Cohnella pontilimi]|uniref:TetR/AcrR family transcriptional regulator n=1 Tax=Cohnella pontilimi TaxID=2564100 RepID=A0A4U0F9J3_9BACL|nr:TetR/AcrR family transcriptional regulator [Cohnella pontilimi]TJY40754.1 TetR/AcrR family transcriptional regulator [Cohnella pontilimi]